MTYNVFGGTLNLTQSVVARNMLQDADATLCTVADALVYARISRIL